MELRRGQEPGNNVEFRDVSDTKRGPSKLVHDDTGLDTGTTEISRVCAPFGLFVQYNVADIWYISKQIQVIPLLNSVDPW